jgi:hypothetical protein
MGQCASAPVATAVLCEDEKSEPAPECCQMSHPELRAMLLRYDHMLKSLHQVDPDNASMANMCASVVAAFCRFDCPGFVTGDDVDLAIDCLTRMCMHTGLRNYAVAAVKANRTAFDSPLLECFLKAHLMRVVEAAA